mgnify:CR=1 FL=1|tara:strand:- start:197 stop:448 length:252 start_codon:yes stop_codon:yes gene_type:complete
MKLTKKQLKIIIKEELEEAHMGRMGLGHSGLGPDVVASEGSRSVTTIEDLWAAIKAGDSGITLELEGPERNLLGQALAHYLGY